MKYTQLSTASSFHKVSILLECPMSIYEVLKNEIIRNGPIRARGDGMYFSDEIFRE